MAPSVDRKKGRESKFTDIGVAGRKTGVTLKDTGIRDEHGFEPMSGIFSSPEKSPVKRNGAANGTFEESTEMDIEGMFLILKIICSGPV
jgi:centromere protein C